MSLSRVAFGEASSLKRIGVGVFFRCGITEISIPDTCEELSDKCFYECQSLSRVTFGESSSLKRIGVAAFFRCSLTELFIPDSVEEICDECFYSCVNLSRVTFGEFSSLKRIGIEAFFQCSLTETQIPNGVEIFDEGVCRREKLSHLPHALSLKQICSEDFLSPSLWEG